eukprot:g67186.t1
MRAHLFYVRSISASPFRSLCQPHQSEQHLPTVRPLVMSSTVSTFPPPTNYILWYDDQDHVLPSSVGYLIIIGLGVFFSFLTLLIVKFIRPPKTASGDEYFTAGRIVGTGLTAADVVSKWTWAATLLQSSSVAYKYGVSGPFWYASGATVQILLFATLAVYMKKNFPSARTFLEIIRSRYGPVVHKFYLAFAILTNFIVTAMLLLGGAAVCQDLAGVPKELAAFLIPFGVVFYTMVGGILATFLASYSNTVVIMICLCVFILSVYTDADGVITGSEDMYNKLMFTQTRNIIDGATWDATGEVKVVYDKTGFLAGNSGGTYLTMSSIGGIIFGVINIVGNFGTVFVDQSYWQSAIAAKPTTSVPGFLLGGVVWFSIPFCLATTLGLACAALEIPMSMAEVNAGLPASRAVVAVMGTGGAVALMIMLYLAVTSTGAAELTAVASLFTYDMYGPCARESLSRLAPEEKGKKLVFVSQIFTLIFGLGMGGLAIALQYIGISLGYMYMLMGVLIGSAVAPCFMAIVWEKASGVAMMGGLVGGFICAVGSWLGSAGKFNDGVVTVDTTGQDMPLLIGNLVALLSSAVIAVVMTLIFPDRFVSEDEYQREREQQATRNRHAFQRKNSARSWKDLNDDIGAQDVFDEDLISEADFDYYGKMARWGGVSTTFILLIIWPIPMYASDYVFTVPFWKGWVVFCIIWALAASVVIILYPLMEIKTLVDDARAREKMRVKKEEGVETVTLTHPTKDDFTSPLSSRDVEIQP